MNDKNTSVFVVAEQGENGIKPVSLQMVGKARQLADTLRARVGAILLGKDLSKDAQELIAVGADTVYAADSKSLVVYQAELYVEIIVKLLLEKRPEILLLGSTFMGRELAPLVAAKLDTGLTAHCIDLIINNDGILEQRIPAYGGLITIVCPEKRHVLKWPQQQMGYFQTLNWIQPEQERSLRLMFPRNSHYGSRP